MPHNAATTSASPAATTSTLMRFASFMKCEFVPEKVPKNISERYAHKFIRPIHCMDKAPYRKLRTALIRKLSVEECNFLFLALGISVDDALDGGRIAKNHGKSLLYVATVLRGAECLLENNIYIRPHLQAILDLRFEDTLDLANTYTNLRRGGIAKNLRLSLIRAYMASLSELERAALRICYGSAWEACVDVTARHYRITDRNRLISQQ